jgi:alkanesulfonate monooxygenase SsuD/methylene tetrahydromethanopterin reductase-like flavin-dependent oxidoreductase (luciferase family)
LKYGVILLPYSVSFDRILDATKHAEALGFDSVWISDHLQRGRTPVLECWSTIAALSSATGRINLGSLATCNSFRNPVLLAKIVSTISEISGGRVEIALGIGYDRSEHVSNGFQFPNFHRRVEALSETLEILESLWKDPVTNFTGRHFNLKGAYSEPKPKKVPKVWLAGRHDLILKEAVKHRYGVNILPYSGTMEKRKLSSLEEVQDISKKIDLLASANPIEKSIYCGDGGVIIGKDEADYVAKLVKIARLKGMPKSEIENSLSNLSIIHGTVKECADVMSRLSALGFDELMMIFPGWEYGDYQNMDLFGREFLSSKPMN